jgi:hypothetical protein
MIYPHIDNTVARDPRLAEAIRTLATSLHKEFGAPITKEIKYQRGAQALGLYPVRRPADATL